MRGALLAAVACVPVWLGCFGGGGITPVRTAFNRGVYHQAAGELEAAIAEYRAAVREDPGDFRARFNLGVALEQRAAELEGEAAAERRAAARRAYEQVLARRPDDLRAAVNLAALRRAEDPAAARAQLDALLAAHPDAVLPRTAYAAHLLAAGEAVRAAELLEGAARSAPADAHVHLLLGNARRALADPEGARAAYRVALRRDQGRRAALLELGRLEVAEGRDAAARAALEQLLLTDPDHGEAHALLAGVRERGGELEAAVLHLWRARDLGAAAEPDAAARLARLYRALLGELQPGGG